jgi:hypothetical protein
MKSSCRGLGSSERQLGFPNAILRAPLLGLATLLLAALTGLFVLVAEFVTAREVIWLAAACFVGWCVSTAVLVCVAYTGHPRFLTRSGFPEYDD